MRESHTVRKQQGETTTTARVGPMLNILPRCLVTRVTIDSRARAVSADWHSPQHASEGLMFGWMLTKRGLGLSTLSVMAA